MTQEDWTDFDKDNSVLKTGEWAVQLSRKLTDEEWTAYGELVNASDSLAYDEKGKEYSLPICLLYVRKVCPDVTATKWAHKSINVLIVSMGMPNKIYEIENAMGLKYAIDAAKKQWKEDYGYLGMRATVISARLATKRDMKGMM